MRSIQSAVLAVFVLSIIAAGACTKTKESEIKDHTQGPGTAKLDPVTDLSFLAYDPATYSFDATLNLRKSQTEPYDRRELYCNHMYELNQGYAGTAIVPAFDYKTGIWLITCWDNLDGLVKNLKKDLTHTVKTGSKLKCEPGADKEQVKCHRIEEYDRDGNTFELFKGIQMVVGTNKGGLLADRVSLQQGSQFNTAMSLHGVTDYDGGDLYCANKKFVTINGISYIRDPFSDSVGIQYWDSVDCFFNEEELKKSFTDKIKVGSKVRCPATKQDMKQTQCTFVEEISE